jgi:methylamine dehydrogenase accessory protein MauD
MAAQEVDMMLLVSQALLWTLLLVLVVAVLALARQVGVLHERIAPVGALAIARGPQPGEAAPKVSARTLAEGTVDIGAPLPPGHLQLLLFVSPSCPVCKQLLPTAKMFAATESLDLVVVGDGEQGSHRKMAARYELPLDRFINSAAVGRAFQVGKLPHAVLISDLGIIVAQGLVNTREHLESLIEVHQTGLRSVQEYLNRPRHQHDQAS